ncbi:MAG: hypothetical protein RXR31_06915 [Thermoproteota archaeon]
MEEELIKDAITIVEKAQSENITLRILGALGIYLQAKKAGCEEFTKSLKRLGEDARFLTDIDLIGYKKQMKKIVELLEKTGFIVDRMVLTYFGDKRIIAYHPTEKYHIDVFLSKLEFSHIVECGDEPGKGRLELDYPTCTTTDLVLEKLQIHEINEKDLKDLITLFYCFPLSETGEETVGKINCKYIATTLSDDWGFWYDAMENLKKTISLAEYLVRIGTLSEDQFNTVKNKITRLIEIIENTPKTSKWLKRSKIGTKKPWYNKVEELTR